MIPKELILILVKLAALLGVALLAPLLRHQALTGPIVNATLYLATILLDIKYAIFIGLLPSSVALSAGLLPPVLAPMIPFIMIGNTILIAVFDSFRKRNYWLGVFFASSAKFLFLKATSLKVTSLILNKKVALNVAAMMSWPQFVNALAGGVLAYFLLRGSKKSS